MFTAMQSVYRPLECLWRVSGRGLECVWIERPAAAKAHESRPDSSLAAHRKVA
jgi:hypothetical protein